MIDVLETHRITGLPALIIIIIIIALIVIGIVSVVRFIKRKAQGR